MSDRVLKGLSAGGGFRAIVVEATEAVQELMDAQLGAQPQSEQRDRISEILGQVGLSAVLVRVEMAPDQRLQLSLRTKDGSCFADSHPDGLLRGVVSGRCPNFGDQTILQVSRVLDDGQLHQGMVEAETDMTATLTQYMLQSEQVVATVGLHVDVEAGVAKSARGFMVQVLPGASKEVMEEVIRALEGIEEKWWEQHPDLLLLDLLGGAGHFTLESEVRFGCTCNQESVLDALGSLNPSEIREMIDDGEDLEMGCQYCGQTYQITLRQLETITT